jgi:hypothetical protein
MDEMSSLRSFVQEWLQGQPGRAGIRAPLPTCHRATGQPKRPQTSSGLKLAGGSDET